MARQLSSVAALLVAGLFVGAAGAAMAGGGFVAAEANIISNRYELRWVTRDARQPVEIRISDRADAAPNKMRLIARRDRDGRASIATHQLPPRPYFWLQTEDGAAMRVAPRTLPLAGAQNARDIGGYATVDGRRVRWGIIYRSSALARLNADDYRLLNTLGLRTIYDLRTEREQAARPTRWVGEPPTMHAARDRAEDLVMRELTAMGDVDQAAARSTVIALFARIPELMAEDYAELFRLLVEGEAPLLVHCSAGKDRTGVAVALLLSALGVPRQTVLSDFALSQQLFQLDALPADDPGKLMLARLPAPLAAALIRTDPAYAAAALDAVTEQYGSIEGYFEQRLGINGAALARLRALYLEG